MDRKKINQGSVALISWVIIVVINFFQLLYVKYTVPNKYTWADAVYYPVSSITIGILLIYFFLLPVFRKVRPLKMGIQIPFFFLHGMAYTAIYIVSIFFQIALWSDNLDLNAFTSAVHQFFTTDFHNIVKNYFILLAIYIAVEYLNKREETLLMQKELENQLKEAKLQALESKLHPHFLFNALNGITALVNENPKLAEKAIVELSDLLRFALEGNLQKGISIREELKLLEKYSSIEKMRFEEQLEISIEIEENIDLNKPIVPPLILQPLLENAILHGFKEISHPLLISLHVYKNKIVLKNNGAPLQREINFGTGLKIVEQRLKHHFQNEASLTLVQNNDLIECSINGIKL